MNDYEKPFHVETDGSPNFTLYDASGKMIFTGRAFTPTIAVMHAFLTQMIAALNAAPPTE